MYKKHRFKTLRIFRIAFLYFAIMIVGFVFMCTDSEYDYNQQIARGFISRDSIFFIIDNPSYKEAFFMTVSVPDGETIDPGTIDTSPIEATEDTFELNNSIQNNGLTAVETLLSSGNADYLASLHNGVMRGVVYKGKVIGPPLLSGRFFYEDECLSDTPMAVVGKNYEEDIINNNGKRYYEYRNREYEVIGIIGLNGESPIDDIIFVNIGSLSPEEQLEGMYYIDCSSNNEIVYEEMQNKSEQLFGCSLKRREIPQAFIDVVSGGMYLKNYLKVLMSLLGCFAYLSVIIQSTREKYIEISAMKVFGIRQLHMFFKTIKNYYVAFIVGISMGLISNVILIVGSVFSLPQLWLLQYSLLILCICIMSFLVLLTIVFIFEWKLNPKGIIQKI